MDLGLNLSGTHVLVTGGTGFIGVATVNALLAAGCRVTCFDIRPPPDEHRTHQDYRWQQRNISDEGSLVVGFKMAEAQFGLVHTCIALASLDLSVLEHHDSLVDMTVEQWRRTHQINVEGTFITAKTWLRALRTHVRELANARASSPTTGLENLRNISLIIVGSESGTFGERGNADYAAGKSAVQVGLLRSLAGDAARVFPRARVNAVAPGPVDTEQFRRECAANPNQLWLDSQATVAMGVPVPPEQVAKSILFLASESWSGNICGQVIAVDSGKQGKVMWMREECR